MHVLNDLCYLLEDEIGQVVKKGELTPSELDNVYKAVKTEYYIETIDAMRNRGEEEYSRGRNSYARDYAYGNSRDYAYGNSRNYARHTREEKVADLERMMANASTEAERRAFMEAIRSIEK